jgi:hypothetical protein
VSALDIPLIGPKRQDAALGRALASAIGDVMADARFILGVNVRALEGEISRAMILVHLYGKPCDMTPLGALAMRHDVAVVEDAAKAIGAVRDFFAQARVGSGD